MLIAIYSACRWMERSEESLFSRFSGWENHMVTLKHLEKIVPKTESISNMKLEKVHSLQTHFADSCVSERKEDFNCQWPSYSFQSCLLNPKETAESRLASTNDFGT